VREDASVSCSSQSATAGEDLLRSAHLGSPELTDEQEQAVARRAGPLSLTAGAGSGKTTVLVERFVRAVHEDGIQPGQILAITFTERAAGELRERIRARLLALGDREAARAAEGAFIGTIHGFCARVLRAHPLPAGVEPGFTVLEEGQAERLRRQAFAEALAGFLEGESPDAVDLVAAYGVESLQRIVLDAHAALRSQGQTRPRLPLPDGSRDGQVGASADPRDEPSSRAGHAARLIGDLLHRFDSAYRRRKRARGALDFDDLELEARDLLNEHPDIRARWAERFELLMVDEFQDTNARQLQLLELLERGNLFTVGDELQGIYGFRHADVRLFAQRRERLRREGAALALTRNFRSRPAILAAVDRVFAARMGEAYTPLVPARHLDRGVRHPDGAPHPDEGAERCPGGRASRRPLAREDPVVELLLTDCRGWGAGGELVPERSQSTPWRIAEARLLAERVGELVEEGTVRPGEVAILLRAVGDMPLYEAALRERGLAALAATGSFWGHRQVGDLLAYLRALANPLDELALYSTLACPLVGLSSDGLVLLARLAREHGCSAWEALERHLADALALLGAADGERLRAFRERFCAERRAVPLSPLADLLRRAIAASDYDTYALSQRWGEQRLANVHKLIRLARRFEAQEGRDLRAFLRHAAHLADAFAGREAHAPVGDGQLDAVRLMSVHAAKGLEFPVVCVADLGRAPRLAAPDLIVEREGRLGLRLRLLGEPEPLPGLAYEELREELLLAQQAEEDRILYVAMTRARERLLLSGAADFARWPAAARRGCAPIAWVAPALVDDLPGLLASEAGSLDWETGAGGSIRCRLNQPGLDGERERAPAPRRNRTAQAAAPPSLEPEAAELRSLEHGWPTVARLAHPQPELPLLADPDTTVSYSSLAQLERCGYRYYLERVLHMAQRHPTGPGRAQDGAAQARARGTVIHALLEAIDFGRAQAPEERRVARMARRLGVSLRRGEQAEIAALLRDALEAPLAHRIGCGRDLRREHPFVFSLGSEHPLVSGVFDLLVREPEGALLVVDYKSDRVAAEDDLEAIVERDYGLQRLLYALAALQAGGAQVHVAHWFLARPHEPALAVFGADEREGLRERALARLQRLRDRGFAVAQEAHRGICQTCPGRGTLCSWSQAEALREPPALGSAVRVATLTS
jgi:ATP-dependent exoDNAse (exonuclease V) beta subunit